MGSELIGTLSKDDDDGSEKVTNNMSLPGNFRPFKLYLIYLDPFTLSNVGDSSWSWIFNEFVQV